MNHTTSSADYQKLQQIYLDWHDGHRPLSGFIKELEQYATNKAIEELEDTKSFGNPEAYIAQRLKTLQANKDNGEQFKIIDSTSVTFKEPTLAPPLKEERR